MEEGMPYDRYAWVRCQHSAMEDAISFNRERKKGGVGHAADGDDVACLSQMTLVKLVKVWRFDQISD